MHQLSNFGVISVCTVDIQDLVPVVEGFIQFKIITMAFCIDKKFHSTGVSTETIIIRRHTIIVVYL